MPEIQAFRGLRYDLGHVGSLSDVIAPPYDVIGPQLQDELYKKHPANVVRLILNRDEPGDDDANNRYSRAAGFLKNWRSEGVLFLEPQASVYVYHQSFASGGQTFISPMLKVSATTSGTMLFNNIPIQLRFPSHGFMWVVHNFIHVIVHNPAATRPELPAPNYQRQKAGWNRIRMVKSSRRPSSMPAESSHLAPSGRVA